MARCQRCSKETNVTIMSKFNTDTICMECKKKSVNIQTMRRQIRLKLMLSEAAIIITQASAGQPICSPRI